MISFFNALTFLWIAKTPPEKAVNKQFGFQTKRARKSQKKLGHRTKRNDCLCRKSHLAFLYHWILLSNRRSIPLLSLVRKQIRRNFTH